MARRRNNTRKSIRGSRSRSGSHPRPKAVLGSLMSPVNVTKYGDISSAIKRIRNSPVTLVLIYANWCGHCHTYMPFFDKMSKVPGRTANSVKIEESTLNKFNNELVKNFPNAKPLEAEGYPTLLAVSRQGQVVSPLPVVREDAPNANLMRSVGKIAENMPAPKTAKSQEIATANIKPANISSKPSSELDMANDVTMPDINLGSEAATSAAVLPPNTSADMSPKVEQVVQETEPLPPIPARLVGGTGLYGALVNATHQLAPAAVLTGIAAGIPRLYRKSMKGSGRKIRKTRKNSANHK